MLLSVASARGTRDLRNNRGIIAGQLLNKWPTTPTALVHRSWDEFPAIILCPVNIQGNSLRWSSCPLFPPLCLAFLAIFLPLVWIARAPARLLGVWKLRVTHNHTGNGTPCYVVDICVGRVGTTEIDIGRLPAVGQPGGDSGPTLCPLLSLLWGRIKATTTPFLPALWQFWGREREVPWGVDRICSYRNTFDHPLPSLARWACRREQG